MFVLVSLSGLLSCGPTVDKLDKLPTVPNTMMDSGEHLLVEPVGDAKGLLGRPVTIQPDGGIEIADALAPGCEITVRETLSSWKRTFHQGADKVAGFSAQLGKVANLRAQYQEGVRLETSVKNERTLLADLRGPCGDLVITSVKMGTGQREFQYRQSIEGGAHGGWQSISAGGGGAANQSTGGALSWDTLQAWAFTIGTVSDANQAEISIDMPGELKPGDRFAPAITAGERDLWLIVITCCGDDQCMVLRPSHKIPAECAPKGSTTKLWPMVAAAAADGGDSMERMIVYGFPEEGDFKQFAPPKGVLSVEDATRYTRELAQRLEQNNEIPARRWTRSEFRYVVKAEPTDEGGEP